MRGQYPLKQPYPTSPARYEEGSHSITGKLLGMLEALSGGFGLRLGKRPLEKKKGLLEMLKA